MFDGRPSRSALYVPASNDKALAKSMTLPADIVIVDLEDAVAPDAKVEARGKAIAAIAAAGRPLMLRVNGLDTPWGRDDLAAAAQSQAAAVLVPKVTCADDVLAYDAALKDAPAEMALWAMIETCASIFELQAIARTMRTTRLRGFVMGINDLAKEMGARQTPDRLPFLAVLTLAVAAARGEGLSVLDGVCNDFNDLDAFSAECQQGLIFGFDGKTLIHPKQVDPCNAVFTPSREEIADAQAIVDAFALPENAGKGTIRVNGRMAELLHLSQAQRLIAKMRMIQEMSALDG